MRITLIIRFLISLILITLAISPNFPTSCSEYLVSASLVASYSPRLLIKVAAGFIMAHSRLWNKRPNSKINAEKWSAIFTFGFFLAFQPCLMLCSNFLFTSLFNYVLLDNFRCRF